MTDQQVENMRVAHHHRLRCVWQRRSYHLSLLAAIIILLAGALHAAPQSAPAAKGKLNFAGRNCQALPGEMISPYALWLWCEVRDIITPKEVSIFKGLRTDDEREQFIEQFWERRNLEPASLENKFKQNYYRRVVSANELFSTTIPGWKTDRGRIYIKYGQPDENELNPNAAVKIVLPNDQAGLPRAKILFEQWRYRYIEGVGTNVVVNFAGLTNTGDLQLISDFPGEKELLLHDPRHDREMPTGPIVPPEPFLKPPHPPAPVKFLDLRAVIKSGQVSNNLIPLLVRTYTFPATDLTELNIIAIQFPTQELRFQSKDGARQANLDVYGQIQSLGGHTVAAFEKTRVVDLPEDEPQQGRNDKFVFEEFVPLTPGRYRIQVALKVEASGRMGALTSELRVPYLGSRLCTSTPLILANSVEPHIPPKDELEPSVIGNTKVLPNPGQVYSREEELGAYLQVYNLGLDPDTHKPNFRVDYEILKDGKPVIEESEDVERLAGVSTEYTIAKTISLKTLDPGAYTFQINIADNVGKQTITPATTFYVR